MYFSSVDAIKSPGNRTTVSIIHDSLILCVSDHFHSRVITRRIRDLDILPVLALFSLFTSNSHPGLLLHFHLVLISSFLALPSLHLLSSRQSLTDRQNKAMFYNHESEYPFHKHKATCLHIIVLTSRKYGVATVW
jgi:hypothetical protein